MSIKYKNLIINFDLTTKSIRFEKLVQKLDYQVRFDVLKFYFILIFEPCSRISQKNSVLKTSNWTIFFSMFEKYVRCLWMSLRFNKKSWERINGLVLLKYSFSNKKRIFLVQINSSNKLKNSLLIKNRIQISARKPPYPETVPYDAF